MSSSSLLVIKNNFMEETAEGLWGFFVVVLIIGVFLCGLFLEMGRIHAGLEKNRYTNCVSIVGPALSTTSVPAAIQCYNDAYNR